MIGQFSGKKKRENALLIRQTQKEMGIMSSCIFSPQRKLKGTRKQILMFNKVWFFLCWWQVCRTLGIIEVDYFGLQFSGSKGENLWLNLRNRISQQMDNLTPCRLRLRVKFFVEPHLILQEQTRYVHKKNMCITKTTLYIASKSLAYATKSSLWATKWWLILATG